MHGVSCQIVVYLRITRHYWRYVFGFSALTCRWCWLRRFDAPTTENRSPISSVMCHSESDNMPLWVQQHATLSPTTCHSESNNMPLWVQQHATLSPTTCHSQSNNMPLSVQQHATLSPTTCHSESNNMPLWVQQHATLSPTTCHSQSNNMPLWVQQHATLSPTTCHSESDNMPLWVQQHATLSPTTCHSESDNMPLWVQQHATLSPTTRHSESNNMPLWVQQHATLSPTTCHSESNNTPLWVRQHATLSPTTCHSQWQCHLFRIGPLLNLICHVTTSWIVLHWNQSPFDTSLASNEEGCYWCCRNIFVCFNLVRWVSSQYLFTLCLHLVLVCILVHTELRITRVDIFTEHVWTSGVSIHTEGYEYNYCEGVIFYVFLFKK